MHVHARSKKEKEKLREDPLSYLNKHFFCTSGPSVVLLTHLVD